MNNTIALAVENGNLYEIEDMVNAALEGGENPKDLLDAMMAGLKTCGDHFEKGEYFLPELMGSGTAFKAGMDILAPKLATETMGQAGKVLLGTVAGDVHDIGKNLVGFLLKGAGFEVVDLGNNNSTEAFIAAVKEHQPDVLGISALLTTTMLGMEDVIKAMDAEGLRLKTKVIIGGGPVSERFAEQIGADAYAFDAVEGVRKIKNLVAS